MSKYWKKSAEGPKQIKTQLFLHSSKEAKSSCKRKSKDELLKRK